MDPWQYNDNNHIMHVCAEPVIPSAALSALLGIVCAEEEGAALLGAEPGAGAAALPRCRGAKPRPCAGTALPSAVPRAGRRRRMAWW